MSEAVVAAAAAVGPPPGMAVRLSSNESPYGPSPAVVEAMHREVGQVHRYPDDQSVSLRDALARHDAVPVERVAVGQGSTALLMDVIAMESRRDDVGGAGPGSVLTYERAFVVYRLGAQVAGARLIEAPLGDDFSRDPDALLASLTGDTRVVVVDNPSNPSGVHLTGGQLRHLVRSVPEHVTVVIDEAYHQFALGQRGYATAGELALEHPRLLVVRTFSKAYALAGLRVGYLTGPVGMVAALDTARIRFNVSSVAQSAALAALGDREHLERTVTGTLEGRRRMARELADLGVPFLDGLGNFLLVELGVPSGPVVAAFAARGVGVRSLNPYGLDRHIRVTVGTPEEVGAFLEAAEEVLPRLMAGPG